MLTANCETIFNEIHTEVENTVKHELSKLINANGLNVLNVPESRNNINDLLYQELNSQIAFLKKELETKDTIIKMLVSDHSQGKTDNATNVKLNKENANDANIKKSGVQNTNNNVTSIETIQDNVDINNTNQFKKVKPRSSNPNKRKITILGDSIVRHIESKKMRMGMKVNDGIYIKSFPGATTADMFHYCKPSQKYENNLYIVHSGKNDLLSDDSAEKITDNLINLASELKTSYNEVLLSTMLYRNDDLNSKALEVNKLLKVMGKNLNIDIIVNTCITSKYICRDGVHLNFNGVTVLANNFLKVINV